MCIPDFGVGTKARRKERGTGTACASAGERIAGRPLCCRWWNHMKVRHHVGCVHMGMSACEVGGEARTPPILYRFCGGLRPIVSMAEGWSFGGAAGRAKGAAKVLHFQRKCCISVFGVPDQREKGQKGGKTARKKCTNRNATLLVKNRGNGGVAGACFRSDSGRKTGAERLRFVVGGLLTLYRFCLCFVQVSSIEPEGHAPSLVACRCI